MKVAISVVLYNQTITELTPLLNSLSNIEADIYFFDNSIMPKENLITLFKERGYHYIWHEKNIGFGSAHNKILKLVRDPETILMIVNPDISFEKNEFNQILEYFQANRSKISGMNPMILNSNNLIQKNQIYNSPLILHFLRKFLPIPSFHEYYDNKYCLNDNVKYNSRNIEILSGCFLITTIKLFRIVNGFDERFFLYFEDWDLSKKLSAYGNLEISNSGKVYHEKKSEANYKLKPFIYFSKSFLKYHFKWSIKSRFC